MGNIHCCLRRDSFDNDVSLAQSSTLDLQEQFTTSLAMPKLVQLKTLPRKQVTLITTNNKNFSNACLRLINIAFQTNQIFPSIMSTYLDMCKYLSQELVGQYPRCNIHVVIVDGDRWDFSIGDASEFVVIEQDKYRVLIFSTYKSRTVRFNTFGVNYCTRLH
jgi:hypothetical protein